MNSQGRKVSQLEAKAVETKEVTLERDCWDVQYAIFTMLESRIGKICVQENWQLAGCKISPSLFSTEAAVSG